MRTISLLLLSAPLLAISVAAVTDAEITTKDTACKAVDTTANEGDDAKICEHELGNLKAQKVFDDAKKTADDKRKTDLETAKNAFTAANTAATVATIDADAAAAAQKDITDKETACNAMTDATKKATCDGEVTTMKEVTPLAYSVNTHKQKIQSEANKKKAEQAKDDKEKAEKAADEAHQKAIATANGTLKNAVHALGQRPLTAAEKTAKAAVIKAHEHKLGAPLDAEFDHFEMEAAKKNGVNTVGELYVLLEAASKEKKITDANKAKTKKIYDDLTKTFEDKDLMKATSLPTVKFTDDERNKLKAAAEGRSKIFATESSASALAAGGAAAAAAAAVVFTLL